ncbi:MAG: DUF3006 domain-containing protein [Angelakisella sp.]
MVIIDRFEGEYAVCEQQPNGDFCKIPKVLLPRGVGEGDCLNEGEGGWVIDAAETLRRRKQAQELLHNLYS